MARSRPAKKRKQLRDEVFPDSSERIWPDEDGGGWAKIPRTLPLIFNQLIGKDLRGDHDLLSTYLVLLTENREEGFIVVENEREFATLSGFAGKRGERSWRERMDKLRELGFIEAKARPGNPYGYVLIVHPVLALRQLQVDGKLDDTAWRYFLEKHTKVGATAPKAPKISPEEPVAEPEPPAGFH
jgi:hypothetical protein